MRKTLRRHRCLFLRWGRLTSLKSGIGYCGELSRAGLKGQVEVHLEYVLLSSRSLGVAAHDLLGRKS